MKTADLDKPTLTSFTCQAAAHGGWVVIEGSPDHERYLPRWFAAFTTFQEMADWLNAQPRQDGFRKPTEAEERFAAQVGTIPQAAHGIDATSQAAPATVRWVVRRDSDQQFVGDNPRNLEWVGSLRRAAWYVSFGEALDAAKDLALVRAKGTQMSVVSVNAAAFADFADPQ